MMPEELVKILEKQQYRMVGNYASTKICHWTKESLRTNRVCYKELWYPPVESHRCMQMTPYMGCNFRCLHCWRVHSGDRGISWDEFPSNKRLDDPEKIVEKAIEERKKLLIGFKGHPKANILKVKEALRPSMMTMSLTGEPTFYPRIGELVEEAGKRNMITFLLTNGSMPKKLEQIDPLPWQLYISLYAHDKDTYSKVARPMNSDAWTRVNETLELFPSLETRKVVRITAIKGYNMKNPKEYSRLILKADPDYVEVKSYEWVGESMRRLPKTAMPQIEDVREFSRKLSNHSSYDIEGEFVPSGVILLKK